MKYVWIIALLLSALFLSSCENMKTAQNLTDNRQNENASKEAKPSEDTPQRQIKIKSENSFDQTYDALKKAIESKEPLKILAESDHSANAKKAEMELRPTKVIMFGNPNLGTPLMKENQEIGVDLPQKMLVFEDADGNVFVVYNDPKVLAKDYNIKGQNKTVDKISKALKGLSEAATKKVEN